MQSFPRIYLDADIAVSAAALRSTVRELASVRTPRAAAPSIVFDLSGRPWPVRAFYRAYERTPYVRDELVGLGCYGLNQAGRERFGAFPGLTADDLFVARLFSREERCAVAVAEFRVETPRTLRDLVAVRTRSMSGAAELAETGGSENARSTRQTVTALAAEAARHPRLALPAVVYVGVTVAARLRARRAETGTWHRDASTR